MYITYRANHYMQALYGAQMLNTPLAHIEVGKDGAVHVSARHSTHDDLNTLMKDSYVQPELVHPLIQDESAVGSTSDAAATSRLRRGAAARGLLLLLACQEELGQPLDGTARVGGRCTAAAAG